MSICVGESPYKQNHSTSSNDKANEMILNSHRVMHDNLHVAEVKRQRNSMITPAKMNFDTSRDNSPTYHRTNKENFNKLTSTFSIQAI